jgi:hypothetical protein
MLAKRRGFLKRMSVFVGIIYGLMILDFFQNEPRNLLDHPYFVGKAWIPTIIILVAIFINEKKTGKEWRLELTRSKIDEDSDQEIYEELSYAIPTPYLLLIGLGLIFASLSLNSEM